MKKVIIFLLIIIIFFIFSYNYFIKTEAELTAEQVADIIKTNNFLYYPENSIVFLNNIKLLDNYLRFKETDFFKQIIELDLFSNFDIDEKIYESGSKTAIHLRNELTFESLINLIGNNISFGISDYENNNNHKFLLVLNLYHQGQFFDRLFELLENENITRNTRYSYEGVTINIVDAVADNVFFEKMYYMVYEEKFIFSSSQKWLQDIITGSISENNIVNNNNFNKLVRNISIDFTSLFFFDIENILNYAEEYFTETNQIQYLEPIKNYKIIQGYLIVNDILKSENLINYDKNYALFNINNYLGKPQIINLLKLLPKESLFTFSITSFDLREYAKLIFNNVMRIRNIDTDYSKQINRFNELLETNIETEIMDLMNGEFNITVKDMVDNMNLPVAIFKIQSDQPKTLYNNLVSVIKNAVENHNLNFHLTEEVFQGNNIAYLNFNFPEFAISKTGFFTFEDYLIVFYGDKIVSDIYEISNNKNISLLSDNILLENQLADKELNILSTINTQRGLDILNDVLSGIVAFPIGDDYLKRYENFYNIDPLFDLLKTLDGFVLYSVKEDNIIRNIAVFNVGDN